MSELPEDLLEEILSRVPATSLKGLRATCKRWNALWKDQRFTEKHFREAPKQSQVFLIMFMLEYRLNICSLSVNGSPSIELIDELRLTAPAYTYKQFDIGKVFHCDGLLLCTNQRNTRLVVCNPCTGQTRWIQPSNHHKKRDTYTLGSYQDIKSNKNSYKILRRNDDDDKARFEIYEFGSNSWRILDVTHDYKLTIRSAAVLTYWVSWGEKETGKWGKLLVSFDYTEEKFGRMPLPYGNGIWNITLSVVGDEKLSVLLQRSDTMNKEIWVTNKIDEWNKILTMDHPQRDWLLKVSFLFDEEKKVFMCCEIPFITDLTGSVYVVGEDKKVQEVNSEEAIEVIYNYVPSLVQIPEVESKEKEGW